MNWRLKAVVGSVLSMVPWGGEAHNWLQRCVTKSLPLPDQDFGYRIKIALQHLSAMRRFIPDRQYSELHHFEFGAGWELAMPLVYASAGIGRQTLYDLHRLVRLDLVFDAARRLNLMNEELRASVPGFSGSLEIEPHCELEAVLAGIGVQYFAPADATLTGLESNSVDVVTSSLVLEHVPQASISRIYREMYRILRPGGIMSHSIDMSDHYSHSDKTVSPWNFLTLTERQWRFANPSFLFQNRLRSSEHQQLILDAGFSIVEVSPNFAGTTEEFQRVSHRLQAPYDAWTDHEDLRATQLEVVALKA